MATQLNNIRISLRRDTLSNWNNLSSQILLPGEVAIVTDGDNEKIKIGNGTSKFGELPYLFERSFSSNTIKALSVSTDNLYISGDSINDILSALSSESTKYTNSIAASVTAESHDYTNGKIKELSNEVKCDINALSGQLTGFYKKNETSSSNELTEEFKKYQLSGEYYKKNETSSNTELANEFKKYQLSGEYYTKNQTSSSSELTEEFKKYQLSGDYYTKSEVSNKNEVEMALSGISSVTLTEAENYTDALIVTAVASSEDYTDSVVATTIASSQDYTDTSISALSSSLNITYVSSDKKMYLKAFNKNIAEVNCADFIKDGMLSSAVLCGNVLVLTFNTDAGKTPISVNLSSFVDNYDSKILQLSTDISVVKNDYLKSSDKTEILNQLSGYYTKNETSSAIEIQDKVIELSNLSNSRVSLLNNNEQVYSNSLSVYKVTREKYHEIINDGRENESAIYIIDDLGINAYNQRISCVADPVNDTDAANKRYVDGIKSTLDSKHLLQYNETDVIAKDEDGNEFTFTIFTKGLS